jgi:hypothetical protein
VRITRERRGEVHVGQTFIGRYRPTAQQKKDHAQNFARAFENALEIADSQEVVDERERMKLPKMFDTTVTFHARVTVASPGDVVEYRAIISEVP